MRTGMIGKKIGMSRVFTEVGEHIPVTLIDVNSCVVVGKRTVEKDGYSALKVGVCKAKLRNTAKPQREEFAKAGIEPRMKIQEFRVEQSASDVEAGSAILPNHFVVGQYVDVTGNATGKGFAGAMKRHNFAGLEASHGVSISHRSHGSTGGRQDPGKVFKNKRMAGHMGTNQVKVPNLEVILIDNSKGLIAVKGAIPGTRGSYVAITDSVKKRMPSDAPYPGAFLKATKPQDSAVSMPSPQEVKESE